ncbi:MAG: hypothetical protein ACHREM_13910 [Polyangiales bacterium]
MKLLALEVAACAAIACTLASAAARACSARDDRSTDVQTLQTPCAEDFNPAASVAGMRAEVVQRIPTARDQSWSDTGNLLGGVAIHGRVSDFVSLELGWDVGMGKTRDGSARYELDLRPLDIITYLNPQACTQLYTVIGTTVDFALYSGIDASSGLTTAQTAFLFGGDVGIGIEHHTSKSHAYSLDVRAYMRTGSINDASGNPLSIVDSGFMLTAGWLSF